MNGITVFGGVDDMVFRGKMAVLDGKIYAIGFFVDVDEDVDNEGSG